MNRFKSIAKILVPVVSLMCASHLFAQERQITFLEEDDASSRAIIEALEPSTERALSVQSTETVVTQVSVSVPVTFSLGSFTLTSSSKQVLNNMAVAMNDAALAQNTFFVEGHTDATGSVQVNLRLSQKRADAVKAYLVANGVHPMRLTTVGYGESMLLAGYEPNASRHRRVEFVRR